VFGCEPGLRPTRFRVEADVDEIAQIRLKAPGFYSAIEAIVACIYSDLATSTEWRVEQHPSAPFSDLLEIPRHDFGFSARIVGGDSDEFGAEVRVNM
jgi:hypothetical protein